MMGLVSQNLISGLIVTSRIMFMDKLKLNFSVIPV